MRIGVRRNIVESARMRDTLGALRCGTVKALRRMHWCEVESGLCDAMQLNTTYRTLLRAKWRA